MNNRFLYEIGVEELPPSYIEPAVEFMADYFAERLLAKDITFSSIARFSTPRRLTIIIDGLAEKQPDITHEIIGPPQKIAYNKHGKLNKIGKGFLQKHRISEKDVKIRNLSKGKYLIGTKLIPGTTTKEILAKIAEEIITKIPFPKAMRWSEEKLTFARPIRWIVTLFNKEVVPLDIGGIASGRNSFGNRFEKLNNKIKIDEVEQYEELLEQHFVIPNRTKRKSLILEQLNKEIYQAGGKLASDETLLDTITNMVEYPFPVVGRFKESYLDLPKEILIVTLSEMQKCFAVETSEGIPSSYFICIANSNPEAAENIRRGNEVVLNARLADAKFYFETDKKTKLIDRIPSLKKITFQKDLGSLYDKMERMRKLGRFIADSLHYPTEKIDRAILLSKTELTTLMLGEKEYTKLQGFMGWQYALADGEDKEVAKAIFEQYLPRFKDDQLPETPSGIVLSIVDKIDTICGCFAVGILPTGSYDPLALRRAGSGIIRILDEHNISLRLDKLISKSLSLFENVAKQDMNTTETSLIEFFKQRIHTHLEGYGLDYDVIDSVMHIDFSDIADLRHRALAVQRFKRKEDFVKLVLGFKRVSNIISEAKDFGKVNKDLFQEEPEFALYEAYTKLKKIISTYLADKNYDAILEHLAANWHVIRTFFDKVLVNVDDKIIRQNRYNLLYAIRRLFLRVADISKIVVEERDFSALHT
jgi:glycyl-tRNA synthetase beta chain